MTEQNRILKNKNYKPVLDFGFVGLVDSMPKKDADSAIVQAARVSYGKGTKSVTDDTGLIRYLLRHHHTTPFEMVEFKFHVKAPIFVARQWFRHRMSSYNEYSGRYSEMVDEFYIPKLENIQPQSKNNKQGRNGKLDDFDQVAVASLMENHSDNAYELYQILLGNNENDIDLTNPEKNEHPFTKEFPGIAKELARAVLPVNNYTEWYWKINLHNLFNFIRLRADSHAQYEIREFANAIYDLIKPIAPAACGAFEDYVINSKSFSAKEITIIKELLGNKLAKYKFDNTELSKREIEEFLSKLKS